MFRQEGCRWLGSGEFPDKQEHDHGRYEQGR
jgi:hypothetical protein